MGVTTRVRDTDPATSAGAVLDTDFQRSQMEVLAVFYIAAGDGMPGLATHELVSFARLLGVEYTPQRIRSACPELERKGWLRRLPGRYKPGPTRKRRAEVWALATR
jgi:hypothetical protein